MALLKTGHVFLQSTKQIDDCGDINDTSSKLGQCFEAGADYDYDYFCDAGCVDVLVDYLDCLGVSDYYDNIIDELEETCDAVTDSIIPTVETCDAVTVTAISTVTAILVAIAATLN